MSQTNSTFIAPARFLLPLVLTATCFAGCASRQRSPFAGLSPEQARILAQSLSLQRDQELQADLRTAFRSHPPENVLILSGGDANGAFGCGVLAGWADVPAGRPKFDVVTGVSTGALMAAFAFLGEPQDDAALRAVYTTIRDKDVFDGPFNLAPPNSVFDTAPLKNLIARYVTPQAVRRIASAHQDGRRLYVTTVELESGEAYIWPVSKIAFDAVFPAPPAGTASVHDESAAVQAAGERIRKILLAAAAIPVFFPPVEIDGGLHVDAGLREAISLRQFMLNFHEAAETQPDALSNRTQPPLRSDRLQPAVWAILNGKLRSPPRPVSENLVSIGVRSLDVYNESLVILSLRDTALVAAAHTPPFQFRWVSEPDELDAGPGPGLFSPMFDPHVTRRLYDAGKFLGQAGIAAWKKGPPALDADYAEPPDQ